MIKVEKIFFGKHEEKEIYKYRLENRNGFQVNILNLGGIITEIYVNDKNGESKNVVLGYDSLEKYIDNPAFLSTGQSTIYIKIMDRTVYTEAAGDLTQKFLM